MIKNIAVLGAGTMGHAIANTFAMHGYPVNLYESFDAVRESVLDRIRDELEFMAREDFISPDSIEETLSRITLYADLREAVMDADYVIEATPEDLELKRELLAQLDAYCPQRTIFGSNTSSLRLADLTAELPKERQAKTLICHWYNPAHLIPIVELSRFGNMSEEDFQAVYDLYETCEKVPIKVLKDIPGMIANRILHAQAREIFYLNSIGAASPEDIDKALMFGPAFRNATTGMLEAADMGGLDIWCAVEDNFFPYLDNSPKANDLMRVLVEKGEYGVKTGKGFFEYPAQTREELVNAFNRRLITQLKASRTYQKE